MAAATEKKAGGKAATAVAKVVASGPGAAAAVVAKKKVIVFVSSCDGVELHHRLLGSFWESSCGSGAPLLPRGSPLLKLHGDMPQPERTAAFLAFTKVRVTEESQQPKV